MEKIDKGYNNAKIEFQIYKSNLIINGCFHISFTKKKPNWWWRFWQKVLLGFEWEDCK